MTNSFNQYDFPLGSPYDLVYDDLSNSFETGSTIDAPISFQIQHSNLIQRYEEMSKPKPKQKQKIGNDTPSPLYLKKHKPVNTKIPPPKFNPRLFPPSKASKKSPRSRLSHASSNSQIDQQMESPSQSHISVHTKVFGSMENKTNHFPKFCSRFPPKIYEEVRKPPKPPFHEFDEYEPYQSPISDQTYLSRNSRCIII